MSPSEPSKRLRNLNRLGGASREARGDDFCAFCSATVTGNTELSGWAAKLSKLQENPNFNIEPNADLLASVIKKTDNIELDGRSVASKEHADFRNPGTDDDRYFKQRAHPDTVEYLWKRLSQNMTACEVLVDGWPALAHPTTGVIFAVTIGSFDVALRLPSALPVSGDKSFAFIAGLPAGLLPPFLGYHARFCYIGGRTEM